MSEPTANDFEQFNWNTPDGNEIVFLRSMVALLSMIGVVLVQIRDRLSASSQPEGRDDRV